MHIDDSRSKLPAADTVVRIAQSEHSLFGIIRHDHDYEQIPIIDDMVAIFILYPSILSEICTVDNDKMEMD